MNHLDYCRRFFATMLGFILFGVAGVLFKIALLHYEFAILESKIKPEDGFENFKRIVGYTAFW